MQHIKQARVVKSTLVTALLFFISCFSYANELINGSFVEGEIITPGESGLWMFELLPVLLVLLSLLTGNSRLFL